MDHPSICACLHPTGDQGFLDVHFALDVRWVAGCLSNTHVLPVPTHCSTDDEDFLDVHFALDVRCTSDDTISVTSKDLQLDPQHPGGRSNLLVKTAGMRCGERRWRGQGPAAEPAAPRWVKPAGQTLWSNQWIVGAGEDLLAV